MKAICDSCGYALEIADNLLVENSLDFSCPNCQAPIKISLKSPSAVSSEDEFSRVHKTEILSADRVPSLLEEETIIKKEEKEITIDKIVEMIDGPSQPKTADIHIPSEISKTTTRAQGDSDISMISSSKTEISEKKHTTDSAIFRNPAGDRVEEETGGQTPAEASQQAPFKAVFEKTERSRKDLNPSYDTLGSSSHIYRRTMIKSAIYLPLILMLIAAIYLVLSVSNKHGGSKVQPSSDQKTGAVLAKANTYLNYDTEASLMLGLKFLSDRLGDDPQNVKFKAELGKFYAILGQRTGDDEILKKSLEISTDILSQSPREADALRAMAIYYLDSPEKSAAYLNRVYDTVRDDSSDRNRAFDLYIEAEIELTIGNPAKAMEKLDAALATDPESLAFWRLKRKISLMLKDGDRVKFADDKIRIYEDKFSNMFPEVRAGEAVAVNTQASDDSKSTRQQLRPTMNAGPQRIMQGRPQELYERLLQKGDDLYYKERYLDAEQELLAALSAARKSPPKSTKLRTVSSIHTLLGYTYLKLFNNDNSLNSFKEAVKYDSTNPEAHKGLATIYENQGDYTEAAKSYRQYLKYRPNAGDAKEINAKIERFLRKKH